MKRTIIVAAALALSACTAPTQSREVLLDAGYSNIEIGGYDWFGCSEDDALRTKFKATGPTGRKVEGVVCAGMFFKGATIRNTRRG
ncbi:hypothetical protein ACQKKG_08300 [Brevundimonas sp. NPDC003935]|uniref:hypothetical protein n=1 Tax=unclassified Brevundimonas TaxID=2622653 RepID=UPI0028969520|nr:hypothetical protein [Brevundimonas sp.]